MDDKIHNLHTLYENINTRISLLENNMLTMLSNTKNNTASFTIPHSVNSNYKKLTTVNDNNIIDNNTFENNTIDKIIPTPQKLNYTIRKRSWKRTIY